MVEDPGQPAVAGELVVLQPEALEPGEVRDDLLRETGEVVGVEGEGDQLGQALTSRGLNATKLQSCGCGSVVHL